MKRFSLLVAVLLAAGCTGERLPSPDSIPGVYKLDVQQGNVVTQEMLAQLEPGMDKNKVRFIMGTPLIVDTFRTDRWDYLYTFQKGSSGKRERRHITLYFDSDDRLAYVGGDVVAAQGEIIVPQRRDTTVVVPGERSRTLFGRMRDGIGWGEQPEEVVPELPDAGTTATEAPAPEEPPATAAGGPGEEGMLQRMLRRFGMGEDDEALSDEARERKYQDPSQTEERGVGGL